MIILAHDYETTGTDPRTCGVVQSAIAVVDIDEGGHAKLIAQETTLHNPGGPIPSGASKVHGIYDSDVAELPHFEEGLNRTFDQAKREFGYDATLGYNNARFDDVIARRVGLEEGKPAIDLMVAANRLMARGFLNRARLVDAYETLVGKPAENAHDALADVMMTLALVQPVMQEMGFNRFDQMVDWVTRPEVNIKLPMPFGKHKGQALDTVPRSYLRWLSNKPDLSQDLALSIREVLS